MSYTEWLKRMPTDDRWTGWQAEGIQLGYVDVPGADPEPEPIPFPTERRAAAAQFPEPEDRGSAVLSPLGEVEYVEDLVRPGRIVVWAAEEGTGKSMSVNGEMAIRLATIGGNFADSWPVLRTGPVLVLSEMHPDDDYQRERTVLEALELDRGALSGRYFRLSLMTAAHGAPALTDAGWRDYITTWLGAHRALLLVVDTATGATQVDPWGTAIQAVYRGLRLMLDAYPALAVVLLLHLRKPSGRGNRRLSDVLGEWARWCDVVVLQEDEGSDRTRLTSYKRVRRPRKITAAKQDGLLVDAREVESAGPKVPLATVVAAVEAQPGMSLGQLGQALGVAKSTAASYVATAVERGSLTTEKAARGAVLVFPTVHRPTVFDEGVERSLDRHQQSTVHRPTHPIGVDGRLDGQSSTRAMRAENLEAAGD